MSASTTKVELKPGAYKTDLKPVWCQGAVISECSTLSIAGWPSSRSSRGTR